MSCDINNSIFFLLVEYCFFPCISYLFTKSVNSLKLSRFTSKIKFNLNRIKKVNYSLCTVYKYINLRNSSFCFGKVFSFLCTLNLFLFFFSVFSLHILYFCANFLKLSKHHYLHLTADYKLIYPTALPLYRVPKWQTTTATTAAHNIRTIREAVHKGKRATRRKAKQSEEHKRAEQSSAIERRVASLRLQKINRRRLWQRRVGSSSMCSASSPPRTNEQHEPITTTLFVKCAHEIRFCRTHL